MHASDAYPQQVLQPDGSLAEPVPPLLLNLLQQSEHETWTIERLLHEVFVDRRFLPDRWLRHIASHKGMSRMQLQRIIMQHPEWTMHPPGRCVIRVCRGESCSDEQAAELLERIVQTTELEPESTRTDGQLSLVTAYCFGHCSDAPVVALDDDFLPKASWEAIHQYLAQKHLLPQKEANNMSDCS